MTDSSKKTKKPVRRPLAVAALVVLIILISWASIRLINVMPEAFSSLASLSESVMNPDENENTDDEVVEIAVSSNSSMINSGENVNLTWQTTESNGTYTFAYECNQGVSVSLLDDESTSKGLDCGTNYNIGDVSNLDLVANSDRVRFADVKYTIAFLGTKDETPSAMGNSSFVVRNNDIDDESTTTESEEEPAEDAEPEVAGETTNTPAPEPTPQYEQEFTYQIPTSDPNGSIDLSARFIAVGRIVNDSFFPGSVVAEDGGAIQFEVKNYGTKTSEEWTFTVELPNGGTYESDEQDPLKPNERAILSIGFAGSEENQHDFEVAIETDEDRNSTNNQFSRVVNFIN